MSNGKKNVVTVLSNTQRITLKHNQDSVTLQKEWKKQENSDWAVGKGIEIPNTVVPDLIQSLQEV